MKKITIEGVEFAVEISSGKRRMYFRTAIPKGWNGIPLNIVSHLQNECGYMVAGYGQPFNVYENLDRTISWNCKGSCD